MTRDEYIREVQRVLNTATEHAASQLKHVLPLVPPRAKRMTIDVFVDQDGEGFLSVRVGLDGPDLYVLQRAITHHAVLFDTQMTELGLEPPLPLMNAGVEDFSVQDTLTDCGANWIASIWKTIDTSTTRLPVTVQSPEGYGTITPIQLKA
jgi:hypothetical protein